VLPAPPIHTPQLVDRALEFAAINGDENPRTLKVVSGRHDDVVRMVMGDRIERDGRRSYGLVMTGRFTMDNVKGGGSGTARVLIEVIDAATGQVSDWGLGNHSPRMRRARSLAALTGATTASTVTLSRAGRTLTATPQGGMFRFTIAPGTYRLTAGACTKTVRVQRVKTSVDCG
jgi:hypothetical protein